LQLGTKVVTDCDIGDATGNEILGWKRGVGLAELLPITPVNEDVHTLLTGTEEVEFGSGSGPVPVGLKTQGVSNPLTLCRIPIEERLDITDTTAG
jgi:hypothetical protein